MSCTNGFMTLGRLVILLLFLCVPLGHAVANEPSCSDLAEAAGAPLGIPKGLLSAISLVETGTGGAAWPWTVNEGGNGMHFKTRAEALAYLEAAIARGVTNIDVGCMQLNYRWHSKGFKTLEEMLDPVRNTTYAALFLLELQKRLGTWELATAHYHSTDADRGARYVEKVVSASGQAPIQRVAAEDVVPRPGNGGPKGSLLLASGRALISIGQAPESDYLALLEVAANSAADAMTAAPEPELLARDDVSPKLRRRWDAVLEARALLNPSP